MAWTDKPATPHMKKLCKSLGSEYEINQHFGLERIIYRDFGNGYEIEISGANTSSVKKPVYIYLWDKKKRLDVASIARVPQGEISECVDWLHCISKALLDCEPCEERKILELCRMDWKSIKRFYMKT